MKNVSLRQSYLIVTVVFLIALMLNHFFQKQIINGQGKGWDGVYYYELASQFQQQKELKTLAPFVYRIATPFLATCVSDDIFTGFKIVNFTAVYVTCLLLLVWFAHFFKSGYTGLGFVLFLMSHWLFGLRFTQYYPTSCDPLAILMIVLILLQLQYSSKKPTRLNFWILAFLVFVGTFVREFIVVFAMGILGYQNPIQLTKLWFVDFEKIKKVVIPFLGVLFSGILGVLCSHVLVEPIVSDYGFARALVQWFYDKSIFEFILGFFKVLGPGIILYFVFNKTCLQFYKQKQSWFFLTLIGLFIAWFTGGDTERFVVWFLPIYFLPLGLIIEKDFMNSKFRLPWVIIILGTVFTVRLFWKIPLEGFVNQNAYQYSFFQTAEQDYVNLFSYHGKTVPKTISIIEYVVVSLVLFFSIRFKQQIKTKEK